MSWIARSRVLLVWPVFATLACGEPAPTEPSALERITEGPHDVAVLDLGELGEIRIELLPEIAPESVAHFVENTRAGKYDGTTFHRVVPGLVIQGGNHWTQDDDPRNDAYGSGGEFVRDEFSDYPHVRGTVSLANKGTQDTSRVQFFIVHQDNLHLDGGYNVFGRVVSGMDTVDAITELEIDKYGRYGPPDRPHPVDARMRSVRIESGKRDAGEPPA